MRAVSGQLLVIINILDVEQFFVDRHIAGYALFRNRQLEILEGIQPGLDLGNQRDIVIAHDVNSQPVGVEQTANILADIQHDFVDIAGGMYLVGDVIEILGKFKPGTHIIVCC